jgi:hypothetical protein|tara:strand:- start:123 stop:299 length:177 start_codon:yes stop_codon:yes gene_type:complete
VRNKFFLSLASGKIMKEPDWMEKRGLTWSDVIKVGFCISFLSAFVIVMIIGAIGAIIS